MQYWTIILAWLCCACDGGLTTVDNGYDPPVSSDVSTTLEPVDTGTATHTDILEVDSEPSDSDDTDLVYSNETDSVYSNETDSIYSDETDSVYSDETDSVYSDETDSVYSDETDSVYSEVDSEVDNEENENTIIAIAHPDWEQVDGCGFTYVDNFGGCSLVDGVSNAPTERVAIKPAQMEVVSDGPMGLLMPNYVDNMGLFERATFWDIDERRCYQMPDQSAYMLSESQAFELYKNIAVQTTGTNFALQDDQRAVLGIRGGYPGSFYWNQNCANRFNDTIVLLWRENGVGRVLEFPLSTESGAFDFGDGNASILWSSRRYLYTNGSHKGYNALKLSESNYLVRDDANSNGHWDDDRNGWWAAPEFDTDADENVDSDDDTAGELLFDYYRGGIGHNIHGAPVDAPLASAPVSFLSAGCQTIPGMRNWTQFIENAWTGQGDVVDYFLLDARDIHPAVWTDCTPDGSHSCPFPVGPLPAMISGDTLLSQMTSFDQYNCSPAEQSGPELMYYLTVDITGTLVIQVKCETGVDVDIHLLSGDDNNACLERDDTEIEYEISPGRYLIAIDTPNDESTGLGDANAGPFQLTVTIEQ